MRESKREVKFHVRVSVVNHTFYFAKPPNVMPLYPCFTLSKGQNNIRNEIERKRQSKILNCGAPCFSELGEMYSVKSEK